MSSSKLFRLLQFFFVQEALGNTPTSWLPSHHYHRHAFVSTLPSASARTASTKHPNEVGALHAKSATKKKNKKSNNKTGGGFGSLPTKQTNKKKNAAAGGGSMVFPELEPQVKQTLVSSPIDGTNEASSGVLSEEMYDRLEDIYGLDKFNFGGEGAIYKSIGVVGESSLNEESTASNNNAGVSTSNDSLFDDILSGGGASQGGTGSALDDLLSPSSPMSTAPISLGDIMDTSSSSSTSNTQQTSTSSSNGSFDLNLIPPFEKFRVLHTDPMVLAIDDFFTPEECDRYVQISLDSEQKKSSEEGERGDEVNNLQPMLLGQSQTVGKDSRSKAQRTSTTWFHYYEGVPELMAKASRLLGLEDGINRWEEPQTVRYRKTEKFTWHLDALSPEEAAKSAGQRVATLLVYLTDVKKEEGGATMFRDLGGENGEPLKVRPKKGSALLFFPAAGGIPNAPFDIRTLHCGEAVAEDAENEKWIAQLWLRQGEYAPTAPVGNEHGNAVGAIGEYCDGFGN